MKQADKQVLEALARLQSDSDFQTILEWMFESREDLRQNLEVAQVETAMRMMQGYCQALGDIHKTAMGARKALAH